MCQLLTEKVFFFSNFHIGQRDGLPYNGELILEC